MPHFPHELLPDLSHIEGLDLSREQRLEHTATFPGFGLKGLYGLGGSGHAYIVALPVPALPAEQWLIGAYDEEEGCVRVFAASLDTWLPAYLLHRTDEAVDWYRRTGHGDELAQLLAQEQAIRAALPPFARPGLPDAVEALVRAWREPDDPAWDPTGVRHLIEPGSLLDRYAQLDAASAGIPERSELIRAAPHYNRPLFELFYDGSGVRDTEVLGNVPTDLAETVFTRCSNQDTPDTGVASDLLRCAAELIASRNHRSSPPLAGLISALAAEDDDTSLHELFFAAGRKWAKAGAVDNAITSYHNAVYWCAVEDEEHHSKAVARLRALAKDHGDPAYRRYVSKYRLADY